MVLAFMTLMKIYDTLLVARLNAHVQIFTNSEYKEEFIREVFKTSLENVIYGLKLNSHVIHHTLEILQRHFDNRRSVTLLERPMVLSAYRRSCELMQSLLAQKITTKHCERLRNHETPSKLLTHFKLEADSAGVCTIYWSRSVQLLLAR